MTENVPEGLEASIRDMLERFEDLQLIDGAVERLCQRPTDFVGPIFNLATDRVSLYLDHVCIGDAAWQRDDGNTDEIIHRLDRIRYTAWGMDVPSNHSRDRGMVYCPYIPQTRDGEPVTADESVKPLSPYRGSLNHRVRVYENRHAGNGDDPVLVGYKSI